MFKLSCRAKPLPEDLEDVLEEDEFIQRNSNCTIFLGFTSNMVSAGIRDTIRFLVQHHMVRVLWLYYFRKCSKITWQSSENLFIFFFILLYENSLLKFYVCPYTVFICMC